MSYYIIIYFLIAMSMPLSTLFLMRCYGYKLGFSTWLSATLTYTVMFPLGILTFLFRYKTYINSIFRAAAVGSR